MNTTIKHPNVTVRLLGENGNAFNILGKVRKEMRRAGCTQEEVEDYMSQATSGDYDHLLQTTMKYVNVE